MLEFEDESLVSPRMIARKTSSLDAVPHRSFNDAEEIGCKCILSRALNSIRIVLFSDKLNLLVPCGPIAILVDKLTSHHVSLLLRSHHLLNSFLKLFPCTFLSFKILFQGWVFLLSLLGIIPLAERLGWATE